jgi:hypothetical protein
MLEDSTICRKSSMLSCDEVKLGYDKNKELMHPLSDSSIKKIQLCNLQEKLSA